MNKNYYEPFNGIQKVKFGMLKNEINLNLGVPTRCFKRGNSDFFTDFYNELGFLIEYNINLNVCAIEFPNYSNIYFHENNLFDYKFNELIDKFILISKDYKIIDNHGVTFFDLGIGVGNVYNSDSIESILIFSKDYWNVT
jgi:hypothetical protein